MAATKLDGTAIAKRIRGRLADKIAEKQKLNPRYKPCLKIIQGIYSFPSYDIIIRLLIEYLVLSG